MNTKNIIPISEHRSHITEHIRLVQETGQPLVITQQGRAAGVLLSPAAYDALVEAAQLNQDVTAIKAGIQSVENGHGVDGRDALQQLARKHNIDFGVVSYRVEYGPEAIAYIDNQIEWLRGQAISDETIASWLRQLLHFTEGLYIAPYRHATAEAESERLGKDIRKTHVGDYLIFYSIDEEQRRVAVVRIRHAAQQVNVGR